MAQAGTGSGLSMTTAATTTAQADTVVGLPKGKGSDLPQGLGRPAANLRAVPQRAVRPEDP